MTTDSKFPSGKARDLNLPSGTRAPQHLNRRFRTYPLIMLIGYGFGVFAYIGFVAGPSRYDIMPDYVAFYVAADLAAQGQLAAAYDAQVAGAAQFAQNQYNEVAPWFYPPSYSLFIFWLPWFPYYIGAVLFLCVSFAFFLFALRPLFVDAAEIWIVFAAPASFINLFHGQNGFLTAGLAALMMTHMPDRQIKAGLALGLLSVKPHLGILMPVVLLAWRSWRTVTVAMGTALALGAVSLALYGPGPWVAFFDTVLQSAGDHISQGTLPISMNASAYAAFQLAGLPDNAALGLHFLGVAIIVWAIVYLVQIGAPYRLVMSFLLAATLLVSPHNFVYDWTFVLISILIIWREGRISGFLRYEQAGLILAYFAPFIIIYARHTGVPTATLAILIPIALTWRRSLYAAQRST